MALFGHYKQLIGQLCEELDIGFKEEDKKITFSPRDDSLSLIKDMQSITIEATLNKGPQFYPALLHANIIGQGFGHSHVASRNGTLKVILPLHHSMDYENFRHRVEEMVNYLEFWKNFEGKRL